MLLSVTGVRAAWFSAVPAEIRQPDGSLISCFVSGDEFYQWYHDTQGYTLLPDANGFYCYAIRSNGQLKPGKYRAGSVNPADHDIQPWLVVPESDYQSYRTAAGIQAGIPSTAPASGIMNNLVIYIRFSDDSEFTTSRQNFDDLFNAVSTASLKSYFSEVSYNQLNISSGHYPSCNQAVNRSYQNPHPRSYYLAYHAVNNPQGYVNEQQRIEREHLLLKNAVDWILINSPIPSTLNLDADNDGKVDNISFITRGGTGTWSQLLWSHTWQLFSYDVMINGKKVWGYNLLPESQTDVKTICHEMFHSLGAPDLYHYISNGIQPAGCWDLMESGGGHMLSWMKYKYSAHSWINQIPAITSSGTYSLNPVTSSAGQCYKLISPNSPNEIFLLEYRQKSGLFESALPGSGLLVYRVDTTLSGNSAGPPDEIYIYRPNGTLSLNGSIGNANFSMETGRTSINDASNPACFLQDGSAGGLQIYDIGICGQTLNFTVRMNDTDPPSSFTTTTARAAEISLSWNRNTSGDPVLLVYSEDNQFGIPVNGVSFHPGDMLPGGGTILLAGEYETFLHTGLGSHQTLHYRIYSIGENLLYSNGISASETTLCGSESLPYTSTFNSPVLPECWSLQHNGNAQNDNWDVVSSASSGFELRSTFQHATQGVSRAILPAVNTMGAISLSFGFKHTFDDWKSGATLKIQTSTDGINWVDEDWSLNSKSNQTIGPVQVTTVLKHNLNSVATYIAFTVEGDLYSYDYWYVDDVQVGVQQVMPVTVDAQPFPALSGTVTGSGSYGYGEMVTLSAIPSGDWQFIGWSENGDIVSTVNEYKFPASERSLLANFSLTEASLGVNIEPSLSGIVTGTGIYPIGSMVSLEAIPAVGYDFIAWKTGDSVISDLPQISIALNSTTQLTALFSLHPVSQFRVSLTAGPQDGGIVLGSGVVKEHEIQSVFAIPYAGWVFESWMEEDAIVSYQPGYEFSVDRDYSLKAVFRQLVTIEAGVNPGMAGFISGAGDFLSGDPVTLVAYSMDGWRFKGWSLNGFILSEDSLYCFPASVDCKLNAEYERNVGYADMEYQQFELFPNPVIGNTHIHLPSGELIQSVSIYTISGQAVLQQIPGNNTSSITLDLSSLLPGSYILRVSTVKGAVRKKIFIKSI